MNQSTNLAMDQATAESKKQFGAILFVVFSIAWVLVRHRFDPWKPVTKFFSDLVDGIAGIKNG